MKVWVGSAWFSGNDPFMWVAIDRKYSKDKARDIFKNLVKGNVEDMYEGTDWGISEEEFFRDIETSGPFLEELEDIVSERDLKKVKRDIKSHGYAYLPNY